MSVQAGFDYQFLAENSPDIICSAGMDRMLRYVSPVSSEILGWKPAEMVGRTIDDFILFEDIHFLAAAFAGQSQQSTVRVRRKDGTVAWMENHTRLVRNSATGEQEEHVIVMRDITARRMQEERLAAWGLTDGPTGLSNRRAFDGALDMEWKRALRGGSQISLLLFDIVCLKGSNGENQTLVGDDMVCSVGGVVTRIMRTTDFVARYGGAEIAIILPDVDITGASKVAQKVRSVVQALVCPEVENQEYGWLVANIGVATGLPECGKDSKMPNSLVLAADCALRNAQREGQTFSAWQGDWSFFGGLIWPTSAN